MTCDRYWRDGVLLVEQGVTDLHHESCEDCRVAHAARAALVAALPMVGGGQMGRTDWQARVWAEIDRVDAKRARRGWLVGAGFALAAAAVIAVLVSNGGERKREQYATAITIEKGAIKKRGGAQVGDRVKAVLGGDDEVRIYRMNDLVFQCGSDVSLCVRDERGRVASYEFTVAGDYTIVIVSGISVTTVGNLDNDLAALVEANVRYRIEQELSVR